MEGRQFGVVFRLVPLVSCPSLSIFYNICAPPPKKKDFITRKNSVFHVKYAEYTDTKQLLTLDIGKESERKINNKLPLWPVKMKTDAFMANGE
jgi:hypothetical protein